MNSGNVYNLISYFKKFLVVFVTANTILLWAVHRWYSETLYIAKSVQVKQQEKFDNLLLSMSNTRSNINNLIQWNSHILTPSFSKRSIDLEGFWSVTGTQASPNTNIKCHESKLYYYFNKEGEICTTDDNQEIIPNSNNYIYYTYPVARWEIINGRSVILKLSSMYLKNKFPIVLDTVHVFNKDKFFIEHTLIPQMVSKYYVFCRENY